MHNYSHDFVDVTEEEVVINMKFVSTFGSAMTFYAVHQTKFESHESDFTTTLVPMQPNAERIKTGFTTGLSSKPLDFTCTEVDLSFMASGGFPLSHVFVLAPHKHLQVCAQGCLPSSSVAWTQVVRSCILSTLSAMIFSDRRRHLMRRPTIIIQRVFTASLRTPAAFATSLHAQEVLFLPVPQASISFACQPVVGTPRA